MGISVSRLLGGRGGMKKPPRCLAKLGPEKGRAAATAEAQRPASTTSRPGRPKARAAAPPAAQRAAGILTRLPRGWAGRDSGLRKWAGRLRRGTRGGGGSRPRREGRALRGPGGPRLRLAAEGGREGAPGTTHRGPGWGPPVCWREGPLPTGLGPHDPLVPPRPGSGDGPRELAPESLFPVLGNCWMAKLGPSPFLGCLYQGCPPLVPGSVLTSPRFPFLLTMAPQAGAPTGDPIFQSERSPERSSLAPAQAQKCRGLDLD